MSKVSNWPAEHEPVTPAAVVARLDELGWVAGSTKLLDHTTGYALAAYDDRVNPVLYVLIALWDGHRVAEYGSDEAAYAAFAPLVRRDESDDA